MPNDAYSLAKTVTAALANGYDSLTWEDLCRRWLGLRRGMVKPSDLDAMFEYLADARAIVEFDKDLFTMLVTQIFFDDHEHSPPRTVEQAKRCCALHWRKSAGIRTIYYKTRKLDLLSATYISQRSRPGGGMLRHGLDTIAAGVEKGKISEAQAGELIEDVAASLMPTREETLKRLFRATKPRLIWKNGGKGKGGKGKK